MFFEDDFPIFDADNVVINDCLNPKCILMYFSNARDIGTGEHLFFCLMV